jgi:hypothetical protein
MSSLDPEDQSCMNAADIMSCEAMTILAKKKRKQILRFVHDIYYIQHVSVSDSAMNRKTEYKLQANGIVSKNICFNPNVMIKTGEWEQQFQSPNFVTPQIYDNMTRPR